MIKRIACTVITTVPEGQNRHNYGRSRPSMVARDTSEPLGKVNSDEGQECFPVGMYFDVIVGD